MKPVVGGRPITHDEAVSLRRIVYGSSIHSFGQAWRQAHFTFQPLDGPFPWGLAAEQTGSRPVILCVQAYVMKHLIFKYQTREAIFDNNVLKPSDGERRAALVNALCDILWKAGAKANCAICLPQETDLFGASRDYKVDGLTEKLHIFDFSTYDDLHVFIRRHMSFFESEGVSGIILYLYSLALSRTLVRVQQDYGKERVQLLTDLEDCTLPLISLLLTGRASRYIHNQDVLYDDDGHLLAEPMCGIPERSDIGFLYWHKEEHSRNRTQVGSMLKTPKKPIWVSQINGHHYGVLFCLNPDLVGDWRTEHVFSLYYYTALPSQPKVARLQVDTRFDRRSHLRTKEEEKKIPAVDQLIMTKWAGATIDWNGMVPFL